jgi:hypothetical protein
MLSALSGFAALFVTSGAQATVYTNDAVLADFYSSSYASLSNYTAGDIVSPTYTPTNATLSTGARVYAGNYTAGLPSGNNWILATFASPTSAIRVFPNIDHPGAGYDGFQYQIEGSNDGTTWTPLFNALTVVGTGEPFTLGSFTGTAPTTVNNVLTPGAGPGGTVGYIADFDFGTSFQYYAFGASTRAIRDQNVDQELSAVGVVPEPSTWAMMLLGFASLGFLTYRRRRSSLLIA